MPANFTQHKYRIFPPGDNALTIEFGNEISTPLNVLAVNLSGYFAENPFSGFIETVPAYASVTVFYDISTVRKNFPTYSTAFEAVKFLIEKALPKLEETSRVEPRLIEIPVNFNADVTLDLDWVARTNNLTPAEVIKIFTAQAYRVFMLGFMPAFPYMGEVAAEIAAPRKQTPRLLVPSGSVGIAGRQTGIYPFDSPGGWQIIGRTDFELFTPQKENPCALEAGDLVKFYPVNE